MRYEREIHDSIHRNIKLTREEMAIIDHPLFQRLRFIAQLGQIKLVYPTGTHTRFEHSIGVVAQVQEMFQRLIEPGSGQHKLRPPPGKIGQAIQFSRIPNVEPVIRLARLCALVHDLGHGPLSHAFDPFAPLCEHVAPLLDDPRLASLVSYRQAMFKSVSGRIDHEAVSCILFALIAHDIGIDAWVVRTVAAVLLHVPAHDSGFGEWVPFLRDLVSGAPVDADRMDYLLRDCRGCAVNYGAYEPERLLKSLACVRTQDGYRVGWRDSGLLAIEQFVNARLQMYKTVYFHKTSRAIDLMLKEIGMEAVADPNAVLIDTSSVEAFAQSYVQLGDETFFHLLTGRLRMDGMAFVPNERIRLLAARIRERRLWKRVFPFLPREIPRAEELLKAVSCEFPQQRFLLDQLPVRATKDLEHGSLLLELDQDRYYTCKPDQPPRWLEASPKIRELRETEESLVNLYYCWEEQPGAPTPKRVHDWTFSYMRREPPAYE